MIALKEISLKDKKITLEESIIVLSEKQIEKILNESSLKTSKEWEKVKRGVKIPLTKDQINEIIAAKDEIVAGLTPRELIDSDLVDMLPHAMKRAIERLEGMEAKKPYELAMKRETYEKIAQVLIESSALEDKAEWKGGSYLRYNFKGKVDENELVVSISFEETMLVITVIVKERRGFFGHEHPELAKLKKLL